MIKGKAVEADRPTVQGTRGEGHRDLGPASQSRMVAGKRRMASEPPVLVSVHLSMEEVRDGRFKNVSR